MLGCYSPYLKKVLELVYDLSCCIMLLDSLVIGQVFKNDVSVYYMSV